MKSLKMNSLFLFIFLVSVMSFSSCEAPDEVVPQQNISITESEADLLLFMREEEKLARDVYLYFNDKYNLNIFENIAASEQKHMDKILSLLNKYDLDDPVSADRGIFTNTDLQQLYNDLIVQGDESLVEALKVGATIEDVDIFDLNNAIENTSQADINQVYGQLKCGSENHMRGFTSQLEAQGATYTPQYITQEEYNEILNGSHGHCGG